MEKLEDSIPFGFFETELNAVDEYFFFNVQSTVKYRSWHDVHPSVQ